MLSPFCAGKLDGAGANACGTFLRWLLQFYVDIPGDVTTIECGIFHTGSALPYLTSRKYYKPTHNKPANNTHLHHGRHTFG